MGTGNNSEIQTKKTGVCGQVVSFHSNKYSNWGGGEIGNRKGTYIKLTKKEEKSPGFKVGQFLEKTGPSMERVSENAKTLGPSSTTTSQHGKRGN